MRQAGSHGIGKTIIQERKPEGQRYSIKGWCSDQGIEIQTGTDAETVKKQEISNRYLHCLCKNNRPTRSPSEEDDDDVDGEQFVCIMKGREWEPLPYPIIIDSGASASTLPKEWCQHVKLWETNESKSGQSFNAANGESIPNLGRRSVTLMSREGAIRDMKFEVCGVTRALGSVSQMCRAGHRAVFNPPWESEGSYIEHVETGQKMWMIERDGIYLLDVRVAPEFRQTANNQDFPRPGP